MGATFTYTFETSSYGGSNFISRGIILIGRNLNSTNSCYIQFYRADKSFTMLRNGTKAIAGQLAPGGGPLILDGGECKLDVTNSSVNVSADFATLIVVANITFKQPSDSSVPFPGLMGSNVINHVQLTDRAQRPDTTWAEQSPAYNVRPNSTDKPFYILSGMIPQVWAPNTPASQTEVTKQYLFQVQHNFSGRYVDWMLMYMAVGKCYIFYSNTDEYFLLGDANGGGWTGGVLYRFNTDGTPSTNSLDNLTGCAIYAGGSVVDRNSALDKLYMNIKFYKSSFQGLKYINMLSSDRGGNWEATPWQAASGTLTVWP